MAPRRERTATTMAREVVALGAICVVPPMPVIKPRWLTQAAGVMYQSE